MGLSIHYRGKFNNNEHLGKMIAEIKDIVEVFKWKYVIFDDEFPSNVFGDDSHDENIYGINFTPPGCETVSICFLSNRRMSDIVHLKFYGDAITSFEKDLLYLLSVKTQYAGFDIHKTIIHLFHYLNKKNYFEDFTLTDEGEYWETGDEELLKQNFKKKSDLLDTMAIALESVPLKEEESYEDYFERIIGLIKERERGKS